MASGHADLVLMGGGLSNCLIAYRLLKTSPDRSFLILERGDTLGGDHTWSFHTSDLSLAEFNWVLPLIERSWPTYSVHFPNYTRTLHGGYHSITSSYFHSLMMECLWKHVRFGAEVTDFSPTQCRLSDGSCYTAGCVIDGRGVPDFSLRCGYQKFLGVELSLHEPHGEKQPILMDGRTDQQGELRFFFTLPWTPHTIQLGEARYSQSPVVLRPQFMNGILEYAAVRGWKIKSVGKEQVGVLPAPLEGNQRDWYFGNGVATVGVRGGFFHALTGYSFPYAVRMADRISSLEAVSSLEENLRKESEKHWQSGNFFRILNRMLFWGARSEEHLKMLSQFYSRPEPLIRRFYAGSLNAVDYLRIFTGKPPLPLVRAVRALFAREPLEKQSSLQQSWQT